MDKYYITNIDEVLSFQIEQKNKFTCQGKECGVASLPFRILCPGSFGEISGSPQTISFLL